MSMCTTAGMCRHAYRRCKQAREVKLIENPSTHMAKDTHAYLTTLTHTVARTLGHIDKQ